MKKRILYLFLLLSVVTLCGACDKDNEENKEVVSLFLPIKATLSRWSTDSACLKSECEKAGLAYEAVITLEPDSENAQLAAIKSAVDKGVKYLVITTTNSSALVNSGVLSTAKEKGCVVVCHDRLIKNTSDVDYYSCCSSEDCGRLQGSFIKQAFLKSGKSSMTIELLAGPVTDDNANLFFNSAMDTIKPMLDNNILTTQSGKTTLNDVRISAWTQAAGYEKMKEILDNYYPNNTYPDVILAPSDVVSLGVIKALDEHNQNITTYPIITGQDNSADALEAIKAGKLSMTLDKQIDKIAENTISIVLDCVNGKNPQLTETINNGSKDIPYISCSPVVITADDLK